MRLIFPTLFCAVLQVSFAKPVSIEPLRSLQEKFPKLGEDNFKTFPKPHPEFIQIRFRNANDEADQEALPRQIPVISDIERIKKVIQIIEFVGGKVDEAWETLPNPEAATLNEENRSEAEIVKSSVVTEDTILDATEETPEMFS